MKKPIKIELTPSQESMLKEFRDLLDKSYSACAEDDKEAWRRLAKSKALTFTNSIYMAVYS